VDSGAHVFHRALGQFFAPFDYQDQNPQGINASFHPPMKIRFVDAVTGQFSPAPFVYATKYENGEWLPDPKQKLPLRFFIHGTPYKLWGFIQPIYISWAPKRPGVSAWNRRSRPRLLFAPHLRLDDFFVGWFHRHRDYLYAGNADWRNRWVYGGRIDDIIMRGCEIMMSIPDFYLLLALAAALHRH
jgi:peptide/nickel transport system permease protein